MGLNLSNSQIAQELELDPDSAHEMATLLRNGILAKEPEVILSGEVECDEVYIVAGHKGKKLPLYLAFFQFVHNTRKRGKALLNSLVERLLA